MYISSFRTQHIPLKILNLLFKVSYFIEPILHCFFKTWPFNTILIVFLITIHKLQPQLILMIHGDLRLTLIKQQLLKFCQLIQGKNTVCTLFGNVTDVLEEDMEFVGECRVWVIHLNLV